MACCLMAPSHCLNHVDLWLLRFCCIRQTAILQQVFKLLFCMMSLKIMLLKLLPHLSGAYVLTALFHADIVSAYLLSPGWNYQNGTWFNSLRPRDAIWRHRSGSTLSQVMACCLMAPSHYLNQCWLIFSKVQWHASEGSFTFDTSTTIH